MSEINSEVDDGFNFDNNYDSYNKNTIIIIIELSAKKIGKN